MPVSDLPSLAILMILAAGFAQGGFLSVFLLAVRRGYRPGRSLLAGLMISLMLSILCQLLSLTGLYTAVLGLFLVLSGMPFLIGPFLYLSLVRFTGATTFHPRELLHFVPFLLNLAFLLTLWGLSEPELGAQLVEVSPQEGPGWYPLLKTVFLMGYGVVSLLRLAKSVVHLRQQRSSFGKINLLWLQNLIGGYLGLLALLALAQVFPGLFQNEVFSADSVTTLVMVGLIYGMGYFWIRYPILLAREEVTALAEPRYKDSSLTLDQAEEYGRRVMGHLKSREPFLAPELTLAQLAAQLKLPSHHLSQVINEQLGQSFFDLVNGSRIEKAKALLQDPTRSHTILEIAFKVGFNSKATFNRAFKKQVRMTPSDYRASGSS